MISTPIQLILSSSSIFHQLFKSLATYIHCQCAFLFVIQTLYWRWNGAKWLRCWPIPVNECTDSKTRGRFEFWLEQWTLLLIEYTHTRNKVVVSVKNCQNCQSTWANSQYDMQCIQSTCSINRQGFLGSAIYVTVAVAATPHQWITLFFSAWNLSREIHCLISVMERICRTRRNETKWNTNEQMNHSLRTHNDSNRRKKKIQLCVCQQHTKKSTIIYVLHFIFLV